ncbi:hypothetical protein O6H91_14G053800 [Diphasiastrum complanatum]|uniref:Uncharacterized protein n=4 Tax=Diphasiastrum complanatum TaxID=34168 RepID=A0ACC2BPF8_DIPCM|nr:hypothetical protein O6H91_14G053800 [Diphasiastrum complanatum]KAJ7531674.1 hypothetical protein O6H91_14G053800 [Diphasiastrum complanatum]KAJ7531675.1 hypothetical protein O6H91_14G053800 [Diphasiastrum complanatum]KAJ7531676.1 hypothetical protein O6H91_14G053800 [Diphasiastrum complanatum]
MMGVEPPAVVTLGQYVADKLSEVACSAREVPVERESFLQLAGFLEKMVPVVIELHKGRDGSPHAIDLLETLRRDVDETDELVDLCTSKSRMYLLMHCRAVVKKLESVTHSMGRSLSMVSLSSVQGREDTKDLVDILSSQMQEVQYQVQDSEERIYRLLERGTSSDRNDLAVQTGILTEIARTVGVQNFARDPVALKNEIQLLRNDLNDTEDPKGLQMMDIIGNMFENWVENQQCPSPSSSAGTPLSGNPRRMEPSYEAFVCPLTKQVMIDPVTTEDGHPFERSAIERWFKECEDKGRPLTSPLTGKQLESKALKPNIALRNIIQEWNVRNEVARIDNAIWLLESSSSEEDILDGLQDFQTVLSRNNQCKEKLKNERLIGLLVSCLRNGERVRCKALATLRFLAQIDDDFTELIGQASLRDILKCLSRKLSQEREEAVSLLLELSKSYSVCEKIGLTSGAVLILVGMTSSKSEDVNVAQKADQTLDNLEMCDQNVRQLAENGRLKPLVTRLIEGSEDIRIEMAKYIPVIPLSSEGRARLAKAGGGILIQMLSDPKLAAREAALQALRTLSTLDSKGNGNGKVLLDAGILPPLMSDLFVGGFSQIPVKLKEVAATILANVVNSCTEWESTPIDNNGNTLTSEMIVHNLLQLTSNTGPAIEAKLLQVLLGLASSPRVGLELASHIKSAGATISLIQFLEAPQKEIRVTSVKLLHCLSEHMGQELADGLRITSRQLGTLVKLLGVIGFTEEMAAAAGLLASLPVRDLALSRALLDEGILPILLSRIGEVHQGMVRIGEGKYYAAFQEGLVGTLARFTYDLEAPEILSIAQQHGLCLRFTSLLQRGNSDEVSRWSAVALENLSTKSKSLSELPDIPQSKGWLNMIRCIKSPPRTPGCPVHGGTCSADGTFCLIEANAILPLVNCLENRNARTVEAAMGALGTLLSDSVDIDRGIHILANAHAILPILVILQDHKTEAQRERAIWIVERLLRNGDMARDISMQQDVHVAVLEAYKSGSNTSKQLAEKSLKHLNKIPNFSGVFHKSGLS